MKRIMLFINNLMQKHIDKVAHALSCAVVLLATVAWFHIKKGFDLDWTINFAVAMSMLFGVGKEFFDLYIKKSKFSIADIVADVAGIVLAYMIF